MEAGTLQKSMEMAMKESEDEQVSRKGKRKKADRCVYLPDEILLDILKRVPEVFLRYKAKYVCTRWFNTITNRILLSHASYILQNIQNFTTRLVDIREEEEGLQVKEQDVDIPHKGTIRSWCNEFLLISDIRHSLYVYNVITKEGSYLPKCNAYCVGCYPGKCGVTLSFDRFKGIYKVFHLFIGLGTIKCQVLILRSDENHAITPTLSKWKKLQVSYKNEGQHIWGDPVIVQGRYLNSMIRYSDDLVSVDMVEEEIHIISLPVSSNDKELVYSIFVMGGFLVLMDRVSWDKAEIWLLKDFHRVKWEKVQSISDSDWYLNRYPDQIITYRVCGVIRKRYIILKYRDGMYGYDVKSGVTKKLDIHIQKTLIESDEHCVVHS